jgi:hypothetical protein
LFNVNNSAASSTSTKTDTKPSSLEVTGHTDDAFKAGNAIGKIIEIVAGMKSDNSLWNMDGAQVSNQAGGGYTETKTGQGTFETDDWAKQAAQDSLQEMAQGTGPDADRARAYSAASANGTIQRTDMSTMGVTSTMTETDHHYADGGFGSTTSYHTQGMDAALQKYTYTDDAGILRDKATDKYAGVEQNGTKFTYVVY